MRRRPSKLMVASATSVTAMVAMAVVTVTGCEARVYGTTPVGSGTPHLTVVAPQGSMAPLPEAPPGEPAPTFAGLEDRAQRATEDAADAGAEITLLVLDRNTGQLVS